MLLTNLKRITRSGFHSFWRNGFVSLASVLVMTITLLVIGSIVFMNALLEASLEEIKNKVDVNVYFVTTAAEPEILALADSLRVLPEVEKVDYVSREQALENFKERHKNDQIILQALQELGDNPLGAVLNIKAKEPSQYAGIAQFLEDKIEQTPAGAPLIDNVNYARNRESIDKLSRIIDASEQLGVIVSIVFVAVSVLITFNTIQLAIYVSREEIGVMRLVGASSSYIRGPFVFTGVMYGVVSGLITLAIFYPLTHWIGGLTESFFIGVNVFSYYLQNFGQMLLVILGAGILIGAISSYLAVMRYLRT